MARKKKVNDDEPEEEYDVLIGFVHEFKFVSDEDLSRLNGHPIEGRVYRILKDPYGYRIHIGRENNDEGLDGLFLGNALDGEQRRYTFKIEIVTPENYLGLPLVEEDRVKVLDWVQSNSDDLREGLKKEKSGDTPVIRTGTDLLKLLMQGTPINGNGRAKESTIKTTPSASISDRERALEATLTLMTHFKNKNTDELVALYDAMYGRILTTITR